MAPPLRIEPRNVKHSRLGGKIQVGGAAALLVNDVYLTWLDKPIVVGRRADRVIVTHLPKRDAIFLFEEIQRVTRVVPPAIAAAKIGQRQVRMGMVVAKIPLVTRTTG